ncbi:hypothetical protein BDZ45DRAFT_590253, partial [Acephala macrosclerotiorum]
RDKACEPCRKAKVSCDHTLPICVRCQKRKLSSRCIYLAAPMTRPFRADYHQFSSYAFYRLKSESYYTAIIPASNPKPTPESGPFIKSGGFFGPTNFSAVFMENRENLGNDEIQISVDTEPSYVPSYESLQSQTFLMLADKQTCGSPRVALGTKILHALPDQHTCKFLLEWYFEKCHECCLPKMSIMSQANSVWTTFGKHLKEPRLTEDLEHISTVICKNAEKGLEEFEEYDRWLEACSGMNLRWESLGAVFGALTTAILSLPERDAFFTTQRGDRRNRRNFSVEMKDCVQACITLSNYMDLINSTMVSLLVKNLILQTVISGDASLVVWRQLGDLVASTTALGLHRQVDTGRPVSFLSESKNRLFTVIFNIDKGSALLTGRPPFLSNRYCRLKLPLDLSEDVLMKGGEHIQRAIEQLDENGWNREGNIHPATSSRAHGQLSPVLNEVLELSLGDPEQCTGDKIKYLMNKLAAVYDNWPAYLHFKLSELGEVPDHMFWRRLCLKLIMLEHRLLLERLAHKQGALDGQSMIDCAREMLELTVLLWVQRDRFVEHHHDYDWMLMCWGVPSSGVLCVELLKQTKNPTGNTLRVPRSEIVQNLSLLIGFLEWVKPAAGNYQLCGRMRIIIKRILDQILNPSPPSSMPQASQESVATPGFDATSTNNMGSGVLGYDPNLFEPGTFDDATDNFDWLNNVDWSRGPWFDLGQDFSAARWS